MGESQQDQLSLGFDARVGLEFVGSKITCEGAMLREGNVSSAEGWRELLDPIVDRYAQSGLRKQFRGDAGLARPEIYEYLEGHEFLYAIRIPANAVLERLIEPHLERPENLEPGAPVVSYHDLLYQAGTWDRPRRVVSKIEWHAGELFARVGFIVTNRADPARGVVRFYNGRGTCEQWINCGRSRLPGRYAVEWLRLSCHQFKDNAVRLVLFVLAYNLGNFLRRLVLPPEMARWSLTRLREKLVKIGARLTRHARRLVLHCGRQRPPGGGCHPARPVRADPQPHPASVAGPDVRHALHCRHR